MSERAALITGLRDLADFLEQHPQVEGPYNPTLNAFADLAQVRAATHMSGTWTKEYISNWVAYRKQFGPVTLDLNIDRDQVCRKVQTGTKRVDAVEAHDEPVFEWICDDGPAELADAKAGA